MPRSAARNHPPPSWFKDYLTSAWILDNRQENLGQVSSFQASRPEEAAHGRKSRQHIRAAQPFIPVSRSSSLMSNSLHQRADASPLGIRPRATPMQSQTKGHGM